MLGKNPSGACELFAVAWSSVSVRDANLRRFLRRFSGVKGSIFRSQCPLRRPGLRGAPQLVEGRHAWGSIPDPNT